jgi:hypothetical protein
MRPSLALERTSLGVARDYISAELVDVVPSGLPPNLLIPPMYEPLVESMLRYSPTFARQCLRIANAPGLTIKLEFHSVPAARFGGTARARTRIIRDNDRLIATVDIAQTVDVVELLAHEIEHVIEQLDGVDLASKARLPDSGVRAVRHEGVVFETIRARRTGLRVAEEVQRARPGDRRRAW